MITFWSSCSTFRIRSGRAFRPWIISERLKSKNKEKAFLGSIGVFKGGALALGPTPG